MRRWTRTLIGLAAIWIAAGLIIFWARKATPTAESVGAFMESHALGGLAGAKRAEVIDRAARSLNRLEFEERQKLRRSGAPERFFGSMTPEERMAFLDATLPAGFQQMMEAFNKMQPEKRKRFVTQALERMREDQESRPPPDLNDPSIKKLVDEGMRSFYSEASAETKLDLAPLIEQMQKGLQGMAR